MSQAVVSVSRAAARELGRGHPWVWESAVDAVRGEPQPGNAVLIVSGPKRRSLGFGFYDPASPIRVRRVGNTIDRPSEQWAEELVRRSMALRSLSSALKSTDSMRLVHGEADGASGLVIDRYAGVATVRFDGDAAQSFWRPLLPAMLPALKEGGIRSLFLRGEGVIDGDAVGDELVVGEDDCRFEVDLENGHKTGLFLDQRPNRRAVHKLAANKRVLNLCSYTGGFSVHAALGGAKSVTSVDISAPAIAACRRNFERSGIDPSAHRFEVADVFDFLGGKSRGRFDLVICDPPSFAPRRKAIEKAKRAYRSLNRRAIEAAAPDGILVTASCSSHMSRELFEDAVAEGAVRARREAIIVRVGCAGADHPTRACFPEGDYLKVLTLLVRN